MENPWLEIGLDVYEGHMALDTVRQLQTLNELMRGQLEAWPVTTAVILGVAGGNGLEHVRRDKYRTVYGVDVNEEYLRAAEARYPGLAGVLRCLTLDLTREAKALPRAELLIADLLIEYIGVPAFREAAEQVGPVYISCVIQQDGASDGWVSESLYARAFDGLNEIHRPVEPETLDAALARSGYRPVLRRYVPLPNGKRLVRLDYTAAGESCIEQ